MNPTGLRPALGDDAAAWTRAVFERGDHAGAAMYGDPATWQHHAALAMLRGDEASFAALAQFACAEARLHLGAARWIHGDTAIARRLLAAVPLPHAQNLLRLLDQPRIRVLTQLPWLADTPTDLLGGAAHDPAFELRNIGYHRDDTQNHPYANVARFVDQGFAPDFYLAAMVEWQHVPPDLQTLPCPIFGHIADHDLHAQTLLPWLHLYDELCVTDRTEWLDVQGLCSARVSSFPKVFGLPGNLPPVPAGARHLDFFVSGTMLDPYHPDKAALLHELLSIPQIDLRVVRGFTGAMAYRALLAASKASFTYVRRPGAMPTRGLEALAMGCAIAVQEESVLRLFVGDDGGALAYGPDTRPLAQTLGTILADWRHHGAAAARGAALVREQFAMPRVASQYLRFLTFRAAAPRAARPLQDTRVWCQKRVSVTRTWLPASPVARRRTMQANFRRLGATLGARPEAARLVDMARELLTEFAFYAERDQETHVERALFDDAIALLAQCERLHPRALVPRFVRIRAQLHHGEPAARLAALQHAFDAVEQGPDAWHVAPHDDVMPFDFHGDLFDYRSYLDLVMRAAKGTPVASRTFAELLLASLAGYVARKTGKVELHARAVAWNPGFARYRLDLARALLDRGGDAGRAQALPLLRELAAGTTEAGDAARLLRRLEPAVPAPLALQRLEQDTLDARVRTRALFDVEQRATALAVRSAPDRKVARARAEISVLVADGGSHHELVALLTDLGGQANANSLEVVVALPADDTEQATALASFRSAFANTVAVASATDAGIAERLEVCRAAATAPLLTIAMAGDRFRPDALTLLADELRQHPAAGLVFANDGWTAHAVAHFDASACAALSCWPTFGRQRLLQTNTVGLHPLWRRTLHDPHGGFDAAYGAAAEHEFWLRATGACDVRQLRTLLASCCLDAGWRRRRDPAAAPEAGERARRRHAGPTLPDTPFVAQRLLPSRLFAPALGDEATSHARLGILDETTLREVRDLEAFYGTALLHGDLPTARRMLETAVENVPSLLSARLALARLLEAIGAPGARDVLAAARDLEPYADLVAARLAEMPAAAPPSAPTPEPPCPTHPPRQLARR